MQKLLFNIQKMPKKTELNMCCPVQYCNDNSGGIWMHNFCGDGTIMIDERG